MLVAAEFLSSFFFCCFLRFLLTVLWTAGVCQKSSLALQLSEVKLFGDFLQVPNLFNLQLDDGLGLDHLVVLVVAADQDEWQGILYLPSD